MGLHRLEVTQRLPMGIEEAWEFFSDPRNLAVITPPSMAFEVTADVPDRIHPGLIVTYRVRPLFNIALDWVTEMTHVVPGELFVDEQRFGPYRFWHHQHHFRPIEGGVEVRDLVHYAVPLGPIGNFVNLLLVRRQLASIFAFRREVLRQRFGSIPDGYEVER